jgi:hypothetical protein
MKVRVKAVLYLLQDALGAIRRSTIKLAQPPILVSQGLARAGTGPCNLADPLLTVLTVFPLTYTYTQDTFLCRICTTITTTTEIRKAYFPGPLVEPNKKIEVETGRATMKISSYLSTAEPCTMDRRCMHSVSCQCGVSRIAGEYQRKLTPLPYLSQLCRRALGRYVVCLSRTSTRRIEKTGRMKDRSRRILRSKNTS